MMERLNGTLQENIISLLAHSDTHGKAVVGVVSPQLFEGEYRTIAERCLDYWQRYDEAPKDHMVDLVDDILSDKQNRKAKTYRRILQSMVDLADGINVKYVMDKLHVFARMQRFKDAILKSAEQLHSEQEIAVAEVEKIWSDLLRERIDTAEPATKLTDYKKLLHYLETQYGEFVLGIKPFDKVEVVPARGTIILFLAAAKRGKSWFLVNVSVKNLLMRHKVVYFTLEMGEESVLLRHYQCIFKTTKSDREVTKRTIVRDDEGRLAGLDEESETLDFTLTGAGAETNLQRHLRVLGPRGENLRIKRFPNRSASVTDLEAYLDMLEITEGFIPDLIVLDYAGILKADPKNPRIAMGRNMEEFRALCIKRNAAGVTAGQLSKEGANAMMAGSTNVAEDWSMIGTADITLVFSSTDAEKALGLGRARVTNAREAEDNFGVLVTQNYQMGQFCMDAIRLNSDYFDMLEDLKAENDLGEDAAEEVEDA
jgi:hypothetical protein